MRPDISLLSALGKWDDPMKYECPVCFYADLPYAPADYNICPCCGTEFGNDDAEWNHQQLRAAWLAGGANWFFGRPPEGWNPWVQLISDRREWLLPKWFILLTVAKHIQTITSTLVHQKISDVLDFHLVP
jgi:hypothetical protein